jgi:hypothetical protein
MIAVPTVLLVRRPSVPWRWLLGYGFGFGVLQFLFLYLAMSIGMPSGLASLVLQPSAPFTVVLAAALLRERLTGRQSVGVGVAVAGWSASPCTAPNWAVAPCCCRFCSPSAAVSAGRWAISPTASHPRTSRSGSPSG